MTTVADENYLKETYLLELEHAHVTTSMLADRLGSTPATVTGMLKKLSERHWMVYEPYRGVTLTEAGRAIALEVLRHHRLIETYLVRALDVPWDRVHEEADRLEHVLSEYLESRMDELLGHPSVDPHGSPIPSPDGAIKATDGLPLSDLEEGSKAEIVEVSDREPKLLEHLDRLGMHPGTRFTVLAVEPIDSLVTLGVGDRRVVLGATSAKHIVVQMVGHR